MSIKDKMSGMFMMHALKFVCKKKIKIYSTNYIEMIQPIRLYKCKAKI